MLREGMGQMSQCPSNEALDTVITNVIIVDAITGIVKVRARLIICPTHV